MFKKMGFDVKVLGSVYFFPINKYPQLNLRLSRVPILKYFGSFMFYRVSLKYLEKLL